MILKLACNTKRLNLTNLLNILERKSKNKEENKSEVYYERI